MTMKVDGQTLSTSEWRWLLIMTGIGSAIILVPLVYVVLSTPDGMVFTGALSSPDTLTYLNKISQGIEGRWLYELRYSPEQGAPAFAFLFYILLGHIARNLSLSQVTIYHISRPLAFTWMSLGIYHLNARWLTDIRTRRLAWLLCIFAGGIGILGFFIPGYSSSPDLLFLPEGYPLQGALRNSHYPFLMGTTAWLACLLSDSLLDETAQLPSPRAIRPYVLILYSLIIGHLGFYALIPLGLAYGVMFVKRWIEREAIPLAIVVWGGIAGIPAVVMVLVMNVKFHQSEVFRYWIKNHRFPLESPLDPWIGYGVLWLLVGYTIVVAVQRKQAEQLFIMAWLGFTLVLSYIPLAFQNRLFFGFPIPIAILSASAIQHIQETGTSGFLRRWLLPVLFGILAIPNLYAVLIPIVISSDEAYMPFIYHDPAHVELDDWIRQNTEHGDVIFSEPQYASYIPILGRHVYYGHEYESLKGDERLESVIDYFFYGKGCDVVQEEAIDYVVMDWELIAENAQD